MKKAHVYIVQKCGDSDKVIVFKENGLFFYTYWS